MRGGRNRVVRRSEGVLLKPLVLVFSIFIPLGLVLVKLGQRVPAMSFLRWAGPFVAAIVAGLVVRLIQWMSA